MIAVIGTVGEDPVRRVMDAAAAAGVDTVVLDEGDAESWHLDVWGDHDGLHAHVQTRTGSADLDSATGAYLRLTSPRRPPGSLDPLSEQRATAATAMITAWADATGIRIANRPAAMASNSSKPYQAALIRRAGFSVPATLVTNDPDVVRAFRAAHGRVIYKSTSGVRSIVHELTDERMRDIARVRHLPTQFQQLLEGTNVRVHVIGDRVFPVRVDSATIDYRYREGGEGAAMTPTELPDDIADRCRELSRSLDLPLAGVDLFEDADGGWWCFEVNPSPAYSCFEEPTGLPMAEALVEWLAARED